MQQHKSAPMLKGGAHKHKQIQVREYLTDWYNGDTPSDFNIDWSNVTINVSGRMTKAWGNARQKENALTGSVDLRITISKHAMESQPWEKIQSTIRHEAVHIWQYQEFGRANHGRTFKQWKDQFDITVYAECRAKEGKYLIECQDCGTVITRQKKSKVVKHPHRYKCNDCGGSLESRLNEPSQEENDDDDEDTDEDLDEDTDTPRCDNCDIPMNKKNGKHGEFWGCPNYPDCRHTKSVEDKECPECGSDMAVRSGKYGKFWGCSNYPECDHTEQLGE